MLIALAKAAGEWCWCSVSIIPIPAPASAGMFTSRISCPAFARFPDPAIIR